MHINFKSEIHEEEEATSNVKVGITEIWRGLDSQFHDYLFYLFLII
jgi:HJR/Mrr/RecB family endonuclease